MQKKTGSANKHHILQTVIRAEAPQCMGLSAGKLSSARVGLKKLYLGSGYPVDGERRKSGWSTYVDRTVLETVEWAKPGLFRVFASNDEIIRFEPVGPEDEQAALDATAYVNRVIFGRNAFRLVHDVLTDGLLQRVGWCKASYERREEPVLEQYEGLSEEEALALMLESGLEQQAMEVTRRLVPLEPLLPEQAMYQLPKHENIGKKERQVVDLTLRKTNEIREIRLEPVPSENVIISQDARDVEDARFIAHWEWRTLSDLRKEGYSERVLEDLPFTDSGFESPEARGTQGVNGTGNNGGGGQNRHAAMRQVKVYEAWFSCDVNNDGIAERIKVVYAGDGENPYVLDWEEWPLYRAPLFAACSVPLPHAVVGLGLADLVSDLQTLKTEITRQYLDNLALQNQGELEVNEGLSGSVDYDSLLSRKPGAVHRTKGDASIRPLAVAVSSAEALQGLDMAGQSVERRTGVTSRTQGLQSNVLQQTATGATILDEAVNQRLELIARIYAEMFFKPLGRYVLHLLHKYHDKPTQVRLKGRYFALDPRGWNPDMDVTVAVGLGTGNRQRQMGAYEQILALQRAFLEKLPQGPVRLSHLVYTCHKLAEAAGLESPERFFGSLEEAKAVESQQAQQAAQEATRAQQQAQLQAKQVQMAAQAQQSLTPEALMHLEREKLQGRFVLEQQKNQSDMEIQRQKAAHSAVLAQQEVEEKARLDQHRLVHETELKIMELRARLALEREEAATRAQAETIVQPSSLLPLVPPVVNHQVQGAIHARP